MLLVTDDDASFGNVTPLQDRLAHQGAGVLARLLDRLVEGRELASFRVIKDVFTADYIEEKSWHCGSSQETMVAADAWSGLSLAKLPQILRLFFKPCGKFGNAHIRRA
ncbi:hypothetical protein O8B39_15340 [Agrobacterium rhizogenes]|nr:hypothetical protein [Rhizobium rhizogenes]